MSSPGSPLIDMARKIGDAYNRWNSPPTRDDPAYHAEMLRQANRSFQQRQDADRAAAAASPDASPAKRVPKRTPARPTAKRK